MCKFVMRVAVVWCLVWCLQWQWRKLMLQLIIDIFQESCSVRQNHHRWTRSGFLSLLSSILYMSWWWTCGVRKINDNLKFLKDFEEKYMMENQCISNWISLQNHTTVLVKKKLGGNLHWFLWLVGVIYFVWLRGQQCEY